MTCRRWAPLLLACGVAFSPGLHAASEAEIAALLQRADFWQARQRDDRAREEVEKALRLAPEHPTALLALGRIQLRANQEREAAVTLQRLRTAHPRHPAAAHLGALLRIRGPDRDRLRQARQLARAGRNDEALAAYRAIFPEGAPDDDIALELAQVQAWTRDGWEPARAQLEALARRHPDDARYQVALASHLSTRKPVAAEVLARLRELSANPDVLIARQARESWRRAVIAMDPVPDTVPVLREYIAANPGETAVSDRLEAVQQEIARGRTVAAAPAPIDPASRARIEAWAALQANRLDEAEAKLREALARKSGDGEATGGLGLVRLRQGRHAEALAFFEDAARLEPGARAKWEGLAKTARYWLLLGEARKAREAGDLAAAQSRAQQARALDPKGADAAMELARIHVAAGRDREAEALVGELGPDQRAAIAASIDAVRAGRLREEAKTQQAGGRLAEAVASLERAAALDRDSPWVRHDLARLYAERGEVERGAALFTELLARRPGDADARYAQALFLSSAGREADAMAALEAIPPAQRTANMASLQRRLWATMQRGRAEALVQAGREAEAREVVAKMRAAIGEDRALAEGVAAIERELALRRLEALLERGDLPAARSVVEEALLARPDDPRALYLASRLAQREGRLEEAIRNERRSLALEDRGESWRYRRLAELIDTHHAWHWAAIDWLYRSGSAGKSRVSAQEIPFAWREGWSAGARWFVRAAPARVSAGTFEVANDYETSTFGSLLLCQPACGVSSVELAEEGLLLGAGFERGPWRVDLGTTPLGFPVTHAVGGVSYRGEWGPASYAIEAARRPVASSLLSYAGMRDPHTGRTWGGVVSSGVRVNVSRDSGGDYGAWGLAGLYRLAGRNVLDNDKAELMGGIYRRLVNEEDRLLTLGATAMLWRFSENAGEYTFGHGGYYSPGNYRSLAFPVAYAWRTPTSAYSVRASVSVAWSKARRAPFFPTDPALQAQAEALAPATFVDPFYAGGSDGRSYGRSFAAAGEHQVAPGIFVGGRIDIERSTNYTPSRFLLYARFTLGGAAARPVALPPESLLPGFAN